MMKRFSGAAVLLSISFLAAACGSYEPEREDFELSVRLEKSEAEIGEQIPYTIELVRKSGSAFSCKGSSTLCGVYFDIATPEKEPNFVYTDDIVTNRFSRDYRWEESGSLETADRQAGVYLFAVRFSVGALIYDFEREIILR